ncbi:type IX secretion/gliding motility protein PorT/SprT [Nonlabens ponticola]|uniref:PorT family protein n=1 Tax=Nonlabens ponticola TaxID=2496866 RepID=A0A3S9MUE4_9FLAO|nr:porin family protein [Nonlabens ponticola]AZQ42796.1 PorT family protein [Nonlabens ponticola]
MAHQPSTKQSRLNFSFPFIVGCLLISSTCSAQLFSKERIANLENFDNQFLTWGFTLGLNLYDYKFDYTEITPEVAVAKNVGFHVGLIGDMRINDYFNLRFEPSAVFTRRDLFFQDPSFTTPEQRLREVNSTYVHLPLLLKVSTKRKNNWKPFIVGGVSYSRNLSSNEENPDDNLAGQFRQATDVFNYELGLGVDLYLFFFKFTPSIRGVFAMSDELVQDNDPNSPYTSNISSMQSRGVFLNFSFQ